MHSILIVEDDTSINELLKEALEKENYRCTQAFSGTEARMLLQTNSYSVVLLDLMLPGIPGEEVLKEIRKKGSIPVIVLTARDTIDDKVEYLRSGADDYITKPFDIQEVLARVLVQIRRNEGQAEAENLCYQGMELDKTNFCVRVEGTELSKITKQEFSILELLLRHPQKKYSARRRFLNMPGKRLISGKPRASGCTYIGDIRKKIKEVTKKEYIETVWGIGYRLHP